MLLMTKGTRVYNISKVSPVAVSCKVTMIDRDISHSTLKEDSKIYVKSRYLRHEINLKILNSS